MSIDNFDDFLMDGSGPETAVPAGTTAPSTAGTSATITPPVNITAITSTVSAAMLSKPPISCMDLFMKNKGGSDDIKPLKEAKQWNTWNRAFLSVAHSYDFKDITDPSYIPDPSDTDACSLFAAQQKC